MAGGVPAHVPWPMAPATPLHHPVHPVRIVTAASLFDGHDAAINIMRRILQSQGCEVIHLGHNRSVRRDRHRRGAGGRAGRGRVVLPGRARRVLPLPGRPAPGRGPRRRAGLRRRRRGHRPDEIAELEAYGVTKIFSPEDGQRLGLAPMINTIVAACDVDPVAAGRLTSSTTCWRDDQPVASPGPSPPSRSAGSSPHWSTPLREAAEAQSRARARDHRHRRLRQVVAHRRAGATASGSTRRTSSASPCSPSTPPGAAAAAPCSATASA